MSFKVIHPNQARDNSILLQMNDSEIIKKWEKGSVVFTDDFRCELWKAHDKKCTYCGVNLKELSNMRIDHVVPKSKVLDNSIDNLVSSCHRCNSIKNKHDIGYFRFCLAVANSELFGIIQPNVAKKLQQIGVKLPIYEKPFYFEILLGGRYE